MAEPEHAEAIKRFARAPEVRREILERSLAWVGPVRADDTYEVNWREEWEIEPGRRRPVTPPQSEIARLALGTEDTYTEMFWPYVRTMARAFAARSDIAIIRVLAAHPWYLHHLAKTPAWKEIADGHRR